LSCVLQPVEQDLKIVHGCDHRVEFLRGDKAFTVLQEYPLELQHALPYEVDLRRVKPAKDLAARAVILSDVVRVVGFAKAAWAAKKRAHIPAFPWLVKRGLALPANEGRVNGIGDDLPDESFADAASLIPHVGHALNLGG
jgi:hypothetical protein